MKKSWCVECKKYLCSCCEKDHKKIMHVYRGGFISEPILNCPCKCHKETTK